MNGVLTIEPGKGKPQGEKSLQKKLLGQRMKKVTGTLKWAFSGLIVTSERNIPVRKDNNSSARSRLSEPAERTSGKTTRRMEVNIRGVGPQGGSESFRTRTWRIGLSKYPTLKKNPLKVYMKWKDERWDPGSPFSAF